MIFTWSLYSQTPSIAFNHLTLDDGLSNSHVNCIIQDNNGFIWIGTEKGLNKYDGYNFTNYYSNNSEENGLVSDEIFSLFIDSDNVLWLGTFQGLVKFHENTDNFTRFSLDSLDMNNANKPIMDIMEGSDGYLWLATSGNGLVRFDKHNYSYVAFRADESDTNSISSNYLLKLYEDSNGNFLIGNENHGIDIFCKNENRFKNFNPQDFYPNNRGSNAVLDFLEIQDGEFYIATRGEGIFKFSVDDKKIKLLDIGTKTADKLELPKEIYDLHKDRNGRIWISSDGNGLYYFDNDPLETVRIRRGSLLYQNIINDNIRTIFEDRQGNLWFVSYEGGINILSNKISIFNSYDLIDPDDKSKITTVSAITIDNENNIWAGIDGGGLKYINRKNGKISHFYTGINKTDFIPGKAIVSLLWDKDDRLLIGSYLEGFSIYNQKSKKFKNFENSSDPGSLSSNYVSSIIQDKKGNIWLGTNGSGLNLFDEKNNRFIRYSRNDTTRITTLVNDWINVMLEDNNGRIWIGTYWGLSVYDPQSDYFINYLGPDTVHEGLSNNIVHSLVETSKGDIWIGTRDGLNKYIPAKNSFIVFNKADGLAGNVIYGIQEDNNGNLWLSTNSGLSRFNPYTLEIHNYYKADGILSNEFFKGASFKSDKGEIFFGNISGLISFFPDSINKKYDIPKPVITEFRIFNQIIKPGQFYDSRVILTRPIYETDTLILKQKDKLFSFDVAALDYILPEKNLYKCKLEGFNNNWRLLDYKQRTITYTNLDAGTYVFKLKASNIDNEWNDYSLDLTIIIKPPFYFTRWAYTFYFLFIIGIIYTIWNFSIKRIKLENEIKLEKIEHNKANEINQAKLQFFTNISHEFRTPITLIIGPLEKMLYDKAVIKKYKASIDLMMKNANRLLRLVNQLMDFRKIETGKMKLKTEKSDIIKFIRDIYTTFKELAEEQKIDFRYITYFKEIICWFDPDKVDKIVFNLLSNAFKFTPEAGEIVILVEKVQNEKGKECVKISVLDNGIGIPNEFQDKIFERFYQSKEGELSYTSGSGVGLSLTRSLVEQHKGVINFTSEINKGTEFNVLLPLDEDAYSDEEKFSPEIPGINKYIHIIPESTIESDVIKIRSSALAASYSVLIVEDNYDLREYIVNELADQYTIYEASNGREGLQIALNELPDVIISDILMPEMDGLELCKKIKENFLTNHIPVILLTARTSIEHRIEGLERGADSYIPKPFNPGHLKIRIKKLLELRNVLKAKFAKDLNSSEPIVIQNEDNYLKEVTDLIIGNLDDPDLNIEKICQKMGISRAHFYRKIKLLTDKSPTEFVRIIRLNEAARLLSKKEKTVSEVCYMVGFNSPSYFSICFKEHFNISPTDYVKKIKKL